MSIADSCQKQSPIRRNMQRGRFALDEYFTYVYYSIRMKISTRARYALRLMVDIARKYDGLHPVNLRRVAEGNDLSFGYLEQLMISLRNASLVRGLSGRKGGYILARPAEQIRLIEIVEAVIGPINLAVCVLNPENCWRSPICESRPIWVMLNTMIREVLDRYTLADMAEERWLERIIREFPKAAVPHALSKSARHELGCGHKGVARRGRTTQAAVAAPVKPRRKRSATAAPRAAGG